jgi:hypothetical protein
MKHAKRPVVRRTRAVLFLFLTLDLPTVLLVLFVAVSSAGSSVRTVRSQRRWLAIEQQVRKKKKRGEKKSSRPA